MFRLWLCLAELCLWLKKISIFQRDLDPYCLFSRPALDLLNCQNFFGGNSEAVTTSPGKAFLMRGHIEPVYPKVLKYWDT